MKSLLQLLLFLTLVVICNSTAFAQLNPKPIGGNAAEEYLRKGEQMLQRGDWLAAEAHFRAAIHNPVNPVWVVCLAVALDKQGKSEEVMVQVKRLIETQNIESLLVIHLTMRNGRLVFVDTSVFGQEQVGIKRYLAAVQSVTAEFEERKNAVTGIEKQIEAINNEILGLDAAKDATAIKSKQDQRAKLERELEKKKKDYSSAYEKRFQKVAGKVSSEIGNALDAYAKKRGFAVILDRSIFKNVQFLSDKSIDVTEDFVKDYNTLYPQ